MDQPTLHRWRNYSVGSGVSALLMLSTLIDRFGKQGVMDAIEEIEKATQRGRWGSPSLKEWIDHDE